MGGGLCCGEDSGMWEGPVLWAGLCCRRGRPVGGAIVLSSHRCLRSIKSIKLIHDNELNHLLISVSSFSYVCFF